MGIGSFQDGVPTKRKSSTCGSESINNAMLIPRNVSVCLGVERALDYFKISA